MSVDSLEGAPGLTSDAAALLARAAMADRAAGGHLAATIDDLFLPDEQRLDDRSRARLGALLRSTIEATGAAIHTRWCSERGVPRDVVFDPAKVLERLVVSGVLRDPELIDELLGRARQDLLGEALRANRPPGAQAALLSQLAESDDQATAAAAQAYRLAEHRSRQCETSPGEMLPPALNRRVTWYVAAALRPDLSGEASATDRSVADAAEHHLRSCETAVGLDARAADLGRLIDHDPDATAVLLAAAIEDGAVALFVALLANRTGISQRDIRALTLDRAGERLWLALRSLDIDRPGLARIGYALGEADPRRDLETFASALDTIVAVPASVAHAAIAHLALPADYQAALRLIDGRELP
ncbi:hypothetical protein [Sphingomonas sp.]|jgi:hypothetical protein|uniref:hypothetical protein n=1 Tax=Sphingomonas sp. TaxID=28214 RepID=UPI00261442A1|nr:hypothetical protein [Sphingomonas sp.]MDF2494430.1 hypothetical protein [Sphingomonas sp.]